MLVYSFGFDRHTYVTIVYKIKSQRTPGEQSVNVREQRLKRDSVGVHIVLDAYHHPDVAKPLFIRQNYDIIL